MAQDVGQLHQIAGILTQVIQGKSVPQHVRSHAQARDLGPPCQALEKHLDGARGKGAAPITDEQRVARLRLRTQLQIRTQGAPRGGVERDLAFTHSHLPGTIPNSDIANFQAGDLTQPHAGLK